MRFIILFSLLLHMLEHLNNKRKSKTMRDHLGLNIYENSITLRLKLKAREHVE